MFNSLRHEKRRAVVAVQVLVVTPLMLGLAAITVDVGIVYNAKADLQRTADAAALAAAGQFAYAAVDVDATEAALAAANDLVDRNQVLGRTLSLDSSTGIILGRAYYDEMANKYNFVPGDAPTNAVRVTVGQTDDSPNGSLSLYLAGVFGETTTDVGATSVALFVRTCYEEADCYDEESAGRTIMCHYSDSGDSDSDNGDSDSDNGDSESQDPDDSEAGRTIIVDTDAVPLFLTGGDTLGACAYCPVGDSDDSDDSQGEFGPPDSSDSDDSDPGDSDGSEDGDSDDSDDSQGEFGPPDSDDSDDSDAGVGKVTICHIPPGNPGNAHTISVGAPAVPAHMAHNDTIGACPDENGNDDAECSASTRVFLIE